MPQLESIIFAAILQPTVNIMMDGTPTAGETFTLLCRVILPDGLATEPQIAWLSPQGNILISEGELTVGNQFVLGNPSRVTTYMVQFSPLLTSHGGTYTCRTTVSSPFGTILQTVTRTQNVSVQSKLVADRGRGESKVRLCL